MRKYRFSDEQKFALWRAYQRKCFYCKEPMAFKEVTVDHVLPESLLDKLDELERIKREYGLQPDHSINDYCNWVPAHAHCNQDKGNFIAPKTPAFIKVLETVKKKGKIAQSEEKRIVSNLKKGELLAKVGIALKKGILSLADVGHFMSAIESKSGDYEPIVVAFGVNVIEALNANVIPDGVSQDYISLCDWLERDLIAQLNGLLSCSFYYPEPSQRTGETLSVRLAFLQIDLTELERFESTWWAILDIQYYSEIFGELDWIGRRKCENLQKAAIIDDAEFIEMLLRGGLLSQFQHVIENDFRAVAIGQDYSIYQSDSYYDLKMWRQILESAGIEEWEIEQAIIKSG